METKFYTVAKIEGDYAYLKDEYDGELFIALSLLPLGADIDTRLKYEDFEFSIVF